jgi:hypothetical protein
MKLLAQRASATSGGSNVEDPTAGVPLGLIRMALVAAVISHLNEWSSRLICTEWPTTPWR